MRTLLKVSCSVRIAVTRERGIRGTQGASRRRFKIGFRLCISHQRGVLFRCVLAAVIGGAFTGAALSLILLALGTGLGLSSVSPWSNTGASASTIGKAAIAWPFLPRSLLRQCPDTLLVAYARSGPPFIPMKFAFRSSLLRHSDTILPFASPSAAFAIRLSSLNSYGSGFLKSGMRAAFTASCADLMGCKCKMVTWRRGLFGSCV